MDDTTRAFLAAVQEQRERLDTAEAWLYGKSVLRAFEEAYSWSFELADDL